MGEGEGGRKEGVVTEERADQTIEPQVQDDVASAWVLSKGVLCKNRYSWVRGAPARNTRNENPRPFSKGSTRASISRTG